MRTKGTKTRSRRSKSRAALEVVPKEPTAVSARQSQMAEALVGSFLGSLLGSFLGSALTGRAIKKPATDAVKVDIDETKKDVPEEP